MADNGIGTIDSETSVDYYVTTVNGQTSKLEPSRGKFPKVVSVDRAGSVKVRKRKKSKRRKKKSNLALEGSSFPTSDDESRYQSSASDGSVNKLPKRSASLSDRDLYKNSKVTFTEEFTKLRSSEKVEKKSNEEHIEDFGVVKRRNRKKPSFRNKRRGVLLDFDEMQLKTETNTKRNEASGGKVSQMNPSSSYSDINQANLVANEDSSKPLSRQDALATLTAFMEEVKEATTVAKQHDEKRKDPILRRSRSLDDLDADATPAEVNEVQVTVADGALTTTAPTTSSFHRKTESIGQASMTSGAVFLSDQEVSIDEIRSQTSLRPNSLSDASNRRSQSLEDLVMATDVATLSKLLREKVLDKPPTSNYGRAAPSTKTRSDSDYGLAHLEQVCRLMEQIANLRNENEALQLKVHVLESRLRDLSGEKGLAGKLKNNAPKRSQTVDRYIDSRYQKIGVERNHSVHGLQNSRRQVDLLNDSADSASLDTFQPSAGFGAIPTNRPVIYSNVSLKKNKRRPYSRDDLDLSNKGRWRFWRAPVRHQQHQDSSNARKQIVSSIKSEHTQGSAVHLKSASVTLDELLKNVDDDFSRKMMQWQTSQTTSRASRAPSRASRASVTSTDTVTRNVHSSSSVVCMPSSDENVKSPPAVNRISAQVQSKPSFKKKFSRWEKAAARKLSWHGDHRRSKSIDRIDVAPPDTVVTLRDQKSQKDFYKSMPCVMTESTQNGVDHNIVLPGVNGGMRSPEWSAMQQAFPTRKNSISDPFRRLISASQSRLAAPLRKKSNKRRSWSFTKRPSSKHFLPTSGDFVSSVELAGNIGDQFTLELDQDDVKGISNGVNDDELQYLKQNTVDLREKLNEMERSSSPVERRRTRHGALRPRPASSMARYQEGRNARSSRDSRRGADQPLYSCDRVSGLMSPLAEEPGPAYSSLPDIKMTSARRARALRRHTLPTFDTTDLRSNDQPANTQSAPCILEPESDRLIAPVVSYVTQRVSKFVRAQDDSVSLERSTSVASDWKSDDESGDPRKVKVQSKKSVTGKVKRGFSKMSPKSRRLRSNATASETSHDSDDNPARSKSSRKKSWRFKIFGGGKNAASQLQVAPPDPESAPSGRTPEHKRPSQSKKIAELSKRFSADSRSRSSTNQSSPPKVRKGLVSRLSARFNRKEPKGGHAAQETVPSDTTSGDTNKNALPVPLHPA